MFSRRERKYLGRMIFIFSIFVCFSKQLLIFLLFIHVIFIHHWLDEETNNFSLFQENKKKIAHIYKEKTCIIVIVKGSF